ncbi:lipopolysaccharide biosynthesis protein [Microcoleus sp. FACHB-SPT15]|uniref:lipopolysaccharide biosynthesis protein n=1 Tax=Microcoleus sp. FACHB-SPT15 TaxID=2692830 RepID=UPI00177B3082|nr:lipopolysaccharide biosynthesis protein [Microcoleus sp. FACHB-SPT15]MBD1809595.1 lipopolysaccharide biosynthesis protein [Microcoleus sp. FACHB-SPT15]
MLLTKLKQLTSGQFIRNVGWLGGAELVNRVFRLGTTVTLARMFSPEDYGLMSIIYTTFEFASVFTLRGGIGAKIIQADEKDVKTIAETSYWLNWILCGAIFIVQCIAAFPIAQFYDKKQLALPLCMAALTYLMLPLFLVSTALIERENRLKVTAMCNAISSLVINSITIILALLGVGVWAIVWAMLLGNPVWILITWKNHSWRPPKTFNIERWREVISFGGSLLGVDLLNRIKGNIDYLLVGRFLGVEALGIYYFAFNAGLGISFNVMNSFSSAIFPYLCEARDDFREVKKRFFSSIKRTSTVVVPLIILQAGLAPLYVPLVFGEKWIPAIPILSMICLSALPYPISFAVKHLLNAVGKTWLNLYWAFFQTLTFAGFVLVAVKGGIFWVAAAVLIHQALTSIYYIWAIKYVFNNK